MTKRYSDAIAISDGASNPSGIAHAIIDACAEIRSEGKGNDAMRYDPALRLMTHQLGFLLGFNEFEMRASDSSWDDWRAECRRAIASAKEPAVQAKSPGMNLEEHLKAARGEL